MDAMRARVRSSSERQSSFLALLAFALAGAFIIWIAASSLSRAQTAAPGAVPSQAPTLQPPSPESGKTSPTLPSTGETLTERLDRSDGVIRPPNVGDSEIRVPPKETGGTMPVIPPPGSPGGDPSVQPK